MAPSMYKPIHKRENYGSREIQAWLLYITLAQVLKLLLVLYNTLARALAGIVVSLVHSILPQQEDF